MGRWIKILQILSSHSAREWSVSELLQSLKIHGFACSKRTLERDMGQLEEQWLVEKGDQGYRFARAAETLIKTLTVGDVASMELYASVVKTLMPQGFTSSMQHVLERVAGKLSPKKNGISPSWQDRVRYLSSGFPLKAPKIESEIWEKLHEALARDLQVQLTYRNAESSKKSTLVVHPMGLVQQAERSYLIAKTDLNTKPWAYAVHRILELKVLDDLAEGSEHFNLDAYLKNGGLPFGNDQQVRLKAKLSSYLATLLQETPMADDQVIEVHDGEFWLWATVTDNWQLTFYLQSQGAAITVMEPLELRKKLATLLREAAAKYDD